MGVTQHIGNLLGDVVIGEDSRPDGIVDIVVHIGNLVAAPDDLSFQGFRPGFAGVAYNAHANLIGQIQAHAVPFQDVHYPQTLLVMTEGLAQAVGQSRLSGVTEGGVTQVVAHGNGLGQILVEP